MSLVSWLSPKGPSGFGYGSTAEQVSEGISLQGQTVLVTGCNSGLGAETTRVLALRGAKVIAAARSLEKANAACALIQGDTMPLACDLSDPKSVRAAIATLHEKNIKLDVIVCNAGIMALPTLEQAFGVELQFFTNHVGHFMLVTGIRDLLTPKGRAVIVSSEAHRQAPKGCIDFDNLAGEKSYAPWTQYGQSKIANILFAKELARKLQPGQTANALHPGVIRTNLSRSSGIVIRAGLAIAGPIALKSIEEGSATSVYLATNPKVADVSGRYFSDSNEKAPRADAEDAETARKLWQRSEEIVAALPST